ncbi:MAG: GGDEF domain-containing protein [Planctomycetota bacterium]
MGTVRSSRIHEGATAAFGTASARQLFSALIARLEVLAPFAVGGLLLASGVCAAASALNFRVWAGPLTGTPLPAALLIAGAGLGVLITALEIRTTRRLIAHAQRETLRAKAQRDVALLQTRRLRAQAEGLALMREIHRSTAIPQRSERLHHILTMLADLFEAREVALFAAVSPHSTQVLPAACLHITNKEELFLAFDFEELTRKHNAKPMHNKRSHEANAHATDFLIAKNSASIVREGRHLFVEGTLVHDDVPVGKAQWRRGVQANSDKLSELDAIEILESALVKIDYTPEACRFAAQALERRRTVRRDERRVSHGANDAIILCVPLIANQRPVGVLRICRSADGFKGPEAEALEELLLESAKHIAMALKKDEDDRQAITDGLTTLYIKRHFLVMLEQLCNEAAVTGESFGLILCDIDYFKKVNDTYGHLSGDMILKGVADVLRKGLRTGDLAFRYGGEEIALLLPHTSVEAAEQTAERLRVAVQAGIFHGEKGQAIPIAISLGVAQHLPGLTGDDLISRADRALYFSKQQGRNRSTRWSPSLLDPLEKADVDATAQM